jgi:hypothetical protein
MTETDSPMTKADGDALIRVARSRAKQTKSEMTMAGLFTTTLRYGEGEDEYVTHIWHPDPQHPTNQAGAVIDFSPGPYPFRYRYVTVVAPGVLREVSKKEEKEEDYDRQA